MFRTSRKPYMEYHIEYMSRYATQTCMTETMQDNRQKHDHRAASTTAGCSAGTPCVRPMAAPIACVRKARPRVFSITVWYIGCGGRLISMTFCDRYSVKLVVPLHQRSHTLPKSILASEPIRVSRMRFTTHFSPSSRDKLSRSERSLQDQRLSTEITR